MILEGKVALYKRAFHIQSREVKRLRNERIELKKEVRRLQNMVETHEDIFFLLI